MKINRGENSEEIVIPKEKAVFWMDGKGRWHNQHGPFGHKKIIEHFNAAIQRDENGYFVGQSHDGVFEKVYFRYEDTALFVLDLLWGDPVKMILNTGERIDLSPNLLFIRNDQLFHHKGEEIIKFSERALSKISEKIECHQGRYSIRLKGVNHDITQLDSG